MNPQTPFARQFFEARYSLQKMNQCEALDNFLPLVVCDYRHLKNESADSVC